MALAARRAGLALDDRQFELLCGAAPHVWAMASRLQRPRGFAAEPSSVFRFAGYRGA